MPIPVPIPSGPFQTTDDEVSLAESALSRAVQIFRNGTSGSALQTPPTLVHTGVPGADLVPYEAVTAAQQLFLRTVFLAIAAHALSSGVHNETPSGAINGVNTVFATARRFVPGSVRLYVSGFRMSPGAGNDFVELSGNSSFSMAFAPMAGDVLLIDYEAVS